MDSMGMILLTIPVFYPVTVALGIDPILFGVLVVMVVEVGLITPPLGMNIFIVRSVAPEVPVQKIFLGALPFVLAFLVSVALVIAIPGLALWLPSLMR
jgi:TRAP-type C4-dicarboxylate transport system permease large subunit